MKSLDQLHNQDKAQILHQLFPNEIPLLLDFIDGFSREMISGYDHWKEDYKNFFFGADDWLAFMQETVSTIEKHGKRMKTSKKLFADHLFGNLLPCYTNHCIGVYVKRRLYHNPKFYHAAHLLYVIEESTEETTEDQN